MCAKVLKVVYHCPKILQFDHISSLKSFMNKGLEEAHKRIDEWIERKDDVMHPFNQAARLRVACPFSKYACSNAYGVL
jgi:hypothetical protein